jgi:hypothetical protein
MEVHGIIKGPLNANVKLKGPLNSFGSIINTNELFTNSKEENGGQCD